MSDSPDTRPPRPGEEIDQQALGAFLAANWPDLPTGAMEVEQFPGGHSNLTYLIRLGGQEFVLRRPPVGSKVKSAHDMGREHRVLSHLSTVWSKAPKPLLYCDDESVVGARFYLMERVRGTILRKKPEVAIDSATARCLCEQLLDCLIELHAVDFEACGLGQLGRPEGYVGRQVSGWTGRYRDSRTDQIDSVDELATWLAANTPTSGPPALIHNDYKFDNVVFSADLEQVIGVLDWEMTTVGDPLMDLGTALSYWVQDGDPAPAIDMRFGPTILPGMMTRSEVAGYYAERSGRSIDDIVFYYAFGLFKTAVVVQQIYFRWKQGLTSDPRFAGLIHAVGMLTQIAQTTISRGHL